MRKALSCLREAAYFALLFCLVDTLPLGFRTALPLFLATWLVSLFFLEAGARLALTLSTAGALLLINLLLPSFMQKTYYRPYEILAKQQLGGFKRYVPSQAADVAASHGDLIALGFAHPEVEQLREPRPQLVRIDRNGYRESSAASGDFDAILVGDSFVEGIGVTQSDSLPAQLGKAGLRVYNLGHNGDIAEYLASLRHAREHFPLRGPALLFVFEGNDFAGRNYCVKEGGVVSGVRDFHRLLKETHLARFLTALSGRIQASAQAPAIIVKESGGKKIGFLLEYFRNALTENWDGACLEALLRSAPGALDAIFFIPEKSRVYSFLFPEEEKRLQRPGAFQAALQRSADRLGLPFYDLTEALRSRALELSSRGEFLFWRDDTHWNPAGIGVAVGAVTAHLRRMPKPSSRLDGKAAP